MVRVDCVCEYNVYVWIKKHVKMYFLLYVWMAYMENCDVCVCV